MRNALLFGLMCVAPLMLSQTPATPVSIPKTTDSQAHWITLPVPRNRQQEAPVIPGAPTAPAAPVSVISIREYIGGNGKLIGSYSHLFVTANYGLGTYSGSCVNGLTTTGTVDGPQNFTTEVQAIKYIEDCRLPQ